MCPEPLHPSGVKERKGESLCSVPYVESPNCLHLDVFSMVPYPQRRGDSSNAKPMTFMQIPTIHPKQTNQPTTCTSPE